MVDLGVIKSCEELLASEDINVCLNSLRLLQTLMGNETARLELLDPNVIIFIYDKPQMLSFFRFLLIRVLSSGGWWSSLLSMKRV